MTMAGVGRECLPWVEVWTRMFSFLTGVQVT